MRGCNLGRNALRVSLKWWHVWIKPASRIGKLGWLCKAGYNEPSCIWWVATLGKPGAGYISRNCAPSGNFWDWFGTILDEGFCGTTTLADCFPHLLLGGLSLFLPLPAGIPNVAFYACCSLATLGTPQGFLFLMTQREYEYTNRMQSTLGSPDIPLSH